MIHRIKRHLSRFHLVLVMMWVALFIWSCTRIVLTLYSWDTSQESAFSLVKIFSIGTLYDLAFYAYAIIPFVIWMILMPRTFWQHPILRYTTHAVTLLTLFGLGFITFAEYIFWEEFNVRFNFIAVDYLVYTYEVTNNIFESYPVPFLLGLIGAISLGIWWVIRHEITHAHQCELSLSRRIVVGSLFLIAPLMAYAALDTGFRKFGENVYQQELAGNGPYEFIAAFRNNELDFKQFYATLDAPFAIDLIHREIGLENPDPTNYTIHQHIVADGEMNNYNVMLIMVESLSSDFLGYFGNTQNLTPNLDNLIDHSLFFNNLYASGTRTDRGLEAVTLSIPPTPGRSIVKRIGKETGLWSLGHVLKQNGYDTKFIYGGRGYFDNMNAFFAGNGYDIIDQSSVPSDEISFENAWGMADEDLYVQAIKAADESYASHKPFFFHLMTTSNHRPYTYPDNRIDIPSGSGRSGAVKYTDWAIGDMLYKVKEKPWYKDTLFVIVADHQASSAGKVDLPFERYHIPMWIYSPAHVPKEIETTLAGQIDIAPTLLNMLNISYESDAFGYDIRHAAPEKTRALIGNYEHLGLFAGGKTAILSPQMKLHLIENADTDHAQEQETTIENPLIQRAIAYYQSASYIFDHRLNEWKGESAPKHN